MGRPPMSDEYRTRIWDLAADGFKPASIFRMIEEEAEEAGLDDWPSERSVRRIVGEYKAKTELERRGYGSFRWPASMGGKDLPWEASRSALDLLYLTNHLGWTRPSRRLTIWYWRAHLAAPHCSPWDTLRQALILEAVDHRGASTGERPPIEAFEYQMAYNRWESDDRERHYNQALGLGAPTDQDLGDMAASGFGPWEGPSPVQDMSAIISWAGEWTVRSTSRMRVPWEEALRDRSQDAAQDTPK